MPGRHYHVATLGPEKQEQGPPSVVNKRNPYLKKREVRKKQMSNLIWKLRSFTTRQEGQGMVEYALILVLVSIVVIVILLTMGKQIENVFSNVVTALSGS
jgi:pilus assembly protein Flp/PilA